MQFKKWLESLATGPDYWENFFLNAWRLDKRHGGLAQDLHGLNSNAITQAAAFQNLDSSQQNTILTRIQQGNGTVADLVQIAVGSSDQAAI
jgi:hypothetical protein